MRVPPPTDGPNSDARVLIVHDLDRLGPIVRDCLAPRLVNGVRGYLAGIAEIPRAPTLAVLVGHDRACRNIETAISAIKAVAGHDTPVIFCCEPVYEFVGRKLLAHGADDYLIFPPERVELERVAGIAPRDVADSPEVNTAHGPIPTVEELTRLADLLPRLAKPDPKRLSAMAALVAEAVNAEWATVSADGKMGRAGRGAGSTSTPVLVEMIVDGELRVGQIRVGPKQGGEAYVESDAAKLRHYGVLLGRLLDAARRTERWRQLALTDDLTGLPNRRQLLTFLREKMALAKRDRMTLSLLVFDIDDFKRYNDQYGHDAGDEILLEVGRLFARCCRKTDMVSRYGGDEFVVVFWDPEGPRTVGSTPPRGVLQVLQRFRAALQQHTFARLGPDAVGCLTISGGLAHFPWQATSSEGLLEAADRALLQAKEAGKNRFWVIGRGDVSEIDESAT